jgi:hypothetical protein
VTTAKVVVTLLGAAAIVWVLWYFLAAPRRGGAESGRPGSR